MSILLFTSWKIEKVNNFFYIPNVHYSYIEYASSKFDKVYVLVSLSNSTVGTKGYVKCELSNVEFICLPAFDHHIDSIKHFFSYWQALKKYCKIVDKVYIRVPSPFTWMPIFFSKRKMIMHYVGDTIDATKHNEKWGVLKKTVMIIGYAPDYFLTLLASRYAKVYTNGGHLVNKLAKYGINATAVISSTIREDSLNDSLPVLPYNGNTVRLVYVGYIRYAKGMNCLMNIWQELKKRNIDFVFDLIGTGEMLEDVKSFVDTNGLKNNVVIHGHIDDRQQINSILRGSDLFVFPSLSEGSPRVVIEAMSQGIPVVSTPVGSLPTTFENCNNIRFFDFDNAQQAVEIIDEYINKKELFVRQRESAYQEIKSKYTIEKFLSKVFNV